MARTTLTPAVAPRLAFPAVTGFVGAGLGWNLVRLADGRSELTTTLVVVLPLLGVVTLAGVLATLLLWTSRVTVDTAAMTLTQRWLWRASVADLSQPGAVRFRWQFSAQGSVGQWKGWFTRPGADDVMVATPWVPGFVELASALRPALEQNPRLAADEYTQRVLDEPRLAADPSSLGKPPPP